jgi:glycine cleavage system H protein
MDAVSSFTVEGYVLAADRFYEPTSNLWVQVQVPGTARIGFDPLGAETTGDIVAISFAEPGTTLARGEPLATVEAAKFVGPVPAPVSGRLTRINEALLDDPARINREPLDAWLAELEGVDAAELDSLVGGREAIAPWFRAAVARFRRQGTIAR